MADSGNSTIRKITPDGNVTTLAGSPGEAGTADGSGSDARFFYPDDVAVDHTGALWVTDTNNQTIRKISLGGIVTTLAGSAGSKGSRDGVGSNARFLTPTKIAVDANGNLYVTDTNNATIRKITPAGLVTTLAGATGQIDSADGIGNAARFSASQGIAVDATGTLYVTEANGHTVRKGVPVDAPAITSATLAGTLAGQPFVFTALSQVFAATFTASSLPAGLTLNTLSGVISGTVTTPGLHTISLAATNIIGTGTLTLSLAVASATASVTLGNLSHTYDGSPHSASATSDPPGLPLGITYNGSPIPPTNAGTYAVNAIAANAEFFGSNTAMLTIGKPEAQVVLSSVTFPYDGTAKILPAVTVPPNLQVDFTLGNIFKPGTYSMSAAVNDTNYEGSATGNLTISEFATPYTITTLASGFLIGPLSIGIVADTSGNVFVADTGHHRIAKISSTGSVTIFAGSTDGTAGNVNDTGTTASFKSPLGLARDSSGNLYVADTSNHQIRKITPAGVVTSLAGGPIAGSTNGTGTDARFNTPTGVAVDTDGNVYVADRLNNKIRKITSTGTVSDFASITLPAGIAVDGSGNVYVTTLMPPLRNIQKITPAGVVTTLAGSAFLIGLTDATGDQARFSGISGLSMDAAGNLYVADIAGAIGNGTIRKITPAGVVTTLAGLGSGTNANGDGIGSQARFSQPVGVSVDPSGNLYVIENGGSGRGGGSGRLRKGTPPAPVISITPTASTNFGEDFSSTLTSNVFASYASSPLPAGISLNAATGIITGAASIPGNYTITLSATNGGGTATVSFALTVRPTFAFFLSQNFTVGQLADPAVSGPAASPAHDGMGNLLKYAFGLAVPQPAAPGDWPVSGTSGGGLTLTFVRRNDIADLNYVVEVSADLQTWNFGPDFTVEISATPLDATRDLVIVRDLTPMTGTGRRFIRLRVEQPPPPE